MQRWQNGITVFMVLIMKGQMPNKNPLRNRLLGCWILDHIRGIQ
jgi:hypothetical protein